MLKYIIILDLVCIKYLKYMKISKYDAKTLSQVNI